MSLNSTARRSSWIDSLAYHGNFLVVFTSSETAIIYAGIPSWLPGLLAAGISKSQDKGRSLYRRSVGRAYHRLVKNKYTGQLVNDPTKVQELRQLFKQ